MLARKKLSTVVDEAVCQSGQDCQLNDYAITSFNGYTDQACYVKMSLGKVWFGISKKFLLPARSCGGHVTLGAVVQAGRQKCLPSQHNKSSFVWGRAEGLLCLRFGLMALHWQTARVLERVEQMRGMEALKEVKQ